MKFSMEKACKNCKFFKAERSDAEVGQCRKLSPTHEGWPIIGGSNWCGEYEQKSSYDITTLG